MRKKDAVGRSLVALTTPELRFAVAASVIEVGSETNSIEVAK